MRIVLYGERGIVAGLVMDIAENPDFLATVLRSISWCGQTDRSWIDHISDAVFFLEPGFHNFGQPDLLIVCRLEDGSQRAVFIHAKTRRYRSCAKPNSIGHRARGYSSSINGQLALNYRFVRALEAADNTGPIVESKAMYEAYAHQLQDAHGKPRSITKGQTLRRIVDPYLRSLPLEHASFVALSADDRNPLVAVSEEYRPAFLSEAGESVWDHVAGQCGFLSLENLDKTINKEGFFRAACQMHVARWGSVVAPACGGRFVRMVPWSDGIKARAQRIADAISPRVQAFSRLGPWPGSYSFVVRGKTVCKLAMDDRDGGSLLVGFSQSVSGAHDYARRIGPAEPCQYGRQPFLMVSTSDSRSDDAIATEIVAFLESLKG